MAVTATDLIKEIIIDTIKPYGLSLRQTTSGMHGHITISISNDKYDHLHYITIWEDLTSRLGTWFNITVSSDQSNAGAALLYYQSSTAADKFRIYQFIDTAFIDKMQADVMQLVILDKGQVNQINNPTTLRHKNHDDQESPLREQDD